MVEGVPYLLRATQRYSLPNITLLSCNLLLLQIFGFMIPVTEYAQDFYTKPLLFVILNLYMK